MAEEEFHEIQLNGKQLVFLFMAGTVAAVVIFLCGLMVGRNIRAPRLEAAAATEQSIGDPTLVDRDPLPPPAATLDGPTPVTVNEELDYPARLEGPEPAEETLLEDAPRRPAAATPPRAATPATKTDEQARQSPPAAPAAQTAAAATQEPPGSGWAVQVQAVKTRTEADAIARRLSAKGYPSFVTSRAAGLFGVRIGKYTNRREAEAIKTKLEKEEQFKPWVTR